MAGHIWDCKRLMKETVRIGVEAAVWAHSKGLEFHEVCMFVGYFMERSRQHRHQNLFHFWDSCVRSRHRYARGTKKGNYAKRYLKGGMFVISQYAFHRDGLIDAPANMVFDKILDEKLVEVPVRRDNYVIRVSPGDN